MESCLQDPVQGRYPLLDGRVRRRGQGPVRPHDLQVRLRRRPLRWRQGRSQDRPQGRPTTRVFIYCLDKAHQLPRNPCQN